MEYFLEGNVNSLMWIFYYVIFVYMIHPILIECIWKLQ